MNTNYDLQKDEKTIKAQLDAALHSQVIMRIANKIIKAKGKDCREPLKDAGLSEAEIDKALKPDFCGHIGFQGWELTNNNAYIKRLQAKHDLLTRKLNVAVTQGNKEIEFEGGVVVYDFDVDRLQIKYPDTPSKEVIYELKRHGFKWAPSVKAWQRQLTDNACKSASWVLKIEVPTPDKVA